MSSVCLSVSLSVTLVDCDHIGWQSWKLIARTISPTSSLFVAEVGWGKVACWSSKAAISLKRIKIEEKLLWRAYMNSPALFRTVLSPTPTASSSLSSRFELPPKLQSKIFGQESADKGINVYGGTIGTHYIGTHQRSFGRYDFRPSTPLYWSFATPNQNSESNQFSPSCPFISL